MLNRIAERARLMFITGMHVMNFSVPAWTQAAFPPPMLPGNNLTDVQNSAAQRQNLGAAPDSVVGRLPTPNDDIDHGFPAGANCNWSAGRRYRRNRPVRHHPSGDRPDAVMGDSMTGFLATPVLRYLCAVGVILSTAPLTPALAGSSQPPGMSRGADNSLLTAIFNLRAGYGLSPILYKAKCDGATDDTTALQNWLNAVVSTGIAGELPPATCIHTGLTIDTSGSSKGIILRGQGAGVSVLKLKPGSNTHSINYIGSANFGNQSKSVFKDLTIDGSYPGNAKGSGDGVHLSDIADTTIYPQGIDFYNVTIKFAARDNLYIGANENNGYANNLNLPHPGRNALTNLAADWKFTNSAAYGADQAGLAITNATNNGSGLVRLTVATHGMTTGQQAMVWGAKGVDAATGLWPVTVIDANTVDLQGSAFSGSYTSQGHIVPVFDISGAADNGSGAVRITTSAANAFTTGDQILIRGVGGAPKASGVWLVTRIDSTHFDLIGSSSSSIAFTSGGTARWITLGVKTSAPTQFFNCNVYSNALGVAITSTSGDGVAFVGGEYNANYIGGWDISTAGIAQPDVITGGAMISGNSAIGDSLFPDIYLANTAGQSITGAFFYLAGNHSSYLIQTDGNMINPVYFYGNAMDQQSHPPWGIGMTLDALAGTNAMLPGARYALNFSQGGNAGGPLSTAFGSRTVVSALASLGAGIGAHDNAMRSMLFGGTFFNEAGDNQWRASILSAISTDATPVRLTTDRTPAGTTNTLNFRSSNFKQVYSKFIVMASKQASNDFAMWDITDLVATRGSTVGSAAIVYANGGASPSLASLAPTASTSALSAASLSVTADTTNGGINVTGTGVAATTIDWNLLAIGLETK